MSMPRRCRCWGEGLRNVPEGPRRPVRKPTDSVLLNRPEVSESRGWSRRMRRPEEMGSVTWKSYGSSSCAGAWGMGGGRGTEQSVYSGGAWRMLRSPLRNSSFSAVSMGLHGACVARPPTACFLSTPSEQSRAGSALAKLPRVPRPANLLAGC